jgi:hypothetical protein
MPDDDQDQPPEETTVTCAGGLQLPTIGAGDGEQPAAV